MLIAVILAASAVDAGHRLDLICPPYIETQQHLVTESSGWHVSYLLPNRPSSHGPVITKHALIGSNFSIGPPERLMLLAPAQSYPKKTNPLIQVNRFGVSGESRLMHICSYVNTKIQISQPVPISHGDCFMEYDTQMSTSIAWCKIRPN